MAKEISAGIIIYRKTIQGPKFLILYHGGGYWNFAKGKIESGERSWQTAVREVKEETGLGLSDLKFRREFKTFDKFIFHREKEKIFKIVILYLAETSRSEVKLSEKHDGYGWFTYPEAMKILSKHEESQKIITDANNFLKKPSPIHGRPRFPKRLGQRPSRRPKPYWISRK